MTRIIRSKNLKTYCHKSLSYFNRGQSSSNKKLKVQVMHNINTSKHKIKLYQHLFTYTKCFNEN